MNRPQPRFLPRTGTRLLAGLALLAVSSAQAATITPEQLVRAVMRARTSIELFLPEGLSSKALERALAAAAYERGVQVRVVTPQGSRKEAGSRLNNLVLAGTNLTNIAKSTTWLYEVRLSGRPAGFIVIDGATGYTGNVGEGFDDLKAAPDPAALRAWVNSVSRRTQPVSRALIHQDVLRQVRAQ